jgi:hypothetical protein
MALSAYPNPQRIGCPSHGALEQVASAPLSSRHRLFQEHIAQCSPCLADLLNIRKQLYRAKKRTRRNAILAVACSLVVLAAVAGALFTRHERSLQTARGIPKVNIPPPAPPIQQARLDLSDRTALRSGTAETLKDGSHWLPAGRLNLAVVLPFGSPAGQYDLGLFRLDQTPLVSLSGEAGISEGKTILHITVDLSRYDRGQYLVGFKRPSGDWTFHEVTIR